MALNLAKVVLGYLKDRPDEKLTARQIAEWIFTTFPDECQAKKQSSQYVSTDAELVQQLVAEIGSQRPRLQTTPRTEDNRGPSAQVLLFGDV